jgi:hypothetical protein
VDKKPRGATQNFTRKHQCVLFTLSYEYTGMYKHAEKAAAQQHRTYNIETIAMGSFMLALFQQSSQSKIQFSRQRNVLMRV